MPLLDHFHPPLGTDRPWESFHATWLSSMTDTITEGLPDGYVADCQVHAGPSFEIDVAASGPDSPPASGPAVNGSGSHGGGGVAVAEPKVGTPVSTATVPVTFADDFEIRVLSSRMGGGRRLVAAVELVSPGNKDRPETRQAFATTVASYLHYGVAVVVVDVVTDRTANLHRAALDRFSPGCVSALPADIHLYAVAYRPVRRGGRHEVDLYEHELAVGRTLPLVPLWLTADTFVQVELEASYSDACRRRKINS